ncbi:MAG TPA: histidine--tRNA ligase [Candidatus Thermoplasmatota archaeon]|nr:histidine--tRNA ligase [Candidatus Thermoplasmatota archaeon]
MPEFSRPRGTRDFGPAEMERRRAAEVQLREIMRRFGYREVATPAFENLELFTAKSGEGVLRQLYHFQDKGGRDLTLRPELTAPALRYYVAEHQNAPKPVKWFYFGNCFRYEEPQSGRYREFWQMGCELIGPQTPEAVAEVVALASACFASLGLENVELRVGHVGLVKSLLAGLPLNDADRGEAHRRIDKKDAALDSFLEAKGVGKKEREAIVTVATTVGEAATIERARGVLAGFPAAMTALSELADVASLLPAFGVPTFLVDLGVVRGLDYYTGVVFEFHSPDLGAESQVCGGGAYALAELFGGQPVGSIGFGLGFDRSLVALERAGRAAAPAPKLSAFVVPIGEKARAEGFRLASRLRAAGLAVDVDLMRRGPSKSLDYANAVGAKSVVLLGEKELSRGVATVKDMQSGEQREVPLDAIAGAL